MERASNKAWHRMSRADLIIKRKYIKISDSWGVKGWGKVKVDNIGMNR